MAVAINGLKKRTSRCRQVPGQVKFGADKISGQQSVQNLQILADRPRAALEFVFVASPAMKMECKSDRFMDLVHEPVVQLPDDHRVEGAVDLPKLLISAVRGSNQSPMLIFKRCDIHPRLVAVRQILEPSNCRRLQKQSDVSELVDEFGIESMKRPAAAGALLNDSETRMANEELPYGRSADAGGAGQLGFREFLPRLEISR